MIAINRQKVMETFAEYTSHYNDQDPKIKLKIDHTYRVAEISERIALWLKLPQEDVDLAWLIGMLHDIGRFEQLRRFGTFSDAQSIDHAQFGVELLYQEGLLKTYLPEEGSLQELPETGNQQDSPEKEEKVEIQTEVNVNTLSIGKNEREIIRTAIWNHSAYRIEEGLDERTELFCHIIRDADKIDILKVNHDVPIEDIYNVTTEELRQSQVTPEVMEAFFEKHAVLRSLKKTPVDNIVGHSALVFELVYPVSYEIVQEQGYLEKILAFQSDNEVTGEQFAQLRECMGSHLEKMRNCQ